MVPLRHITLLDIKVSLVESSNSFPSPGRTIQYFPLTALLFESRRNTAINSEKDHNLKPLKTDIFLDDVFDSPPCLVFELASRPLHLVTYRRDIADQGFCKIWDLFLQHLILPIYRKSYSQTFSSQH